MYILGINISHHTSTCLMYNDKVVYYIEEERLSRDKYHQLEKHDNKLYCLDHIKKYTNHINYIVFSSFGRRGNDDQVIIQSIIDQFKDNHITYDSYIFNHNQHHLYHASCGFYGSEFNDAVCLVLDGGGSYDRNDFEKLKEEYNHPFREIESIYSCDYKSGIKELYKHYALLDWDETTAHHDEIFFTSESSGYKKVFSHTSSCGDLFNGLSHILKYENGGYDAGKLMGLSSYGKYQLSHFLTLSIPMPFMDREWFYKKEDEWITVRKIFNIISSDCDEIQQTFIGDESYDISKPYNALHLLNSMFAYKLQLETQKHTIRLIEKAIKLSNKKNIILSGGYALNCVNNFYYRKMLPKDISIFIDPISNDAGTAIGAAKLLWHSLNKNDMKLDKLETLYLGP